MSAPTASLHVDWTRCDGHGLCAELLPSRITRDEWGFPLVAATQVGPDERRAAERAVSLCPALALRLSAS